MALRVECNVLAVQAVQAEASTPIKQDIKHNKLRHYHDPICWNYGMLPQVRLASCVGAVTISTSTLPLASPAYDGCRCISQFSTNFNRH